MVDFGIKDFIDIIVVAFLLYSLYKMMKQNGSINIFVGIVTMIFVWVLVSQVLRMRLLGSILDNVFSVGAVALVVLFQDEIRHMLTRVGARNHWWHTLTRVFDRKRVADQEAQEAIDRIVLACKNMSEQRVGALIVMANHDDLNAYIATGERIDAHVSTRLIEQIFYKNTPLHDGAMIISSAGRIAAAACILPVSHDQRIPKSCGLRHRAALGLSENADAKVIIVSEETGSISVAHNRRLHRNISLARLQELLMPTDKKEKK